MFGGPGALFHELLTASSRVGRISQSKHPHAAREDSSNTQKVQELGRSFLAVFAADRWVGLLVGPPYSVPENLCDLYIPHPDDDSFASFHYRHLSVLTGRVIDCLQSVRGPPLSTVGGVDEKIDEITAQLPAGYLDPNRSSCVRMPKRNIPGPSTSTCAQPKGTSIHVIILATLP